MTNKSEPVVTQEDRDAMNKWAMSDYGLDQLAKDFAAHRAAAVARREAEIVKRIGMLLAQRDHAMLTPGDFIDEIRTLNRELKNGGGA